MTRLKAGGRFLDVGCCLGQDIRKLAFDGVPGENLAGAELNAGFIELGYELFQDREALGSKIVAANILEPLQGGPLETFEGYFDVVQLGMILHLFTREEQIVAFENALTLLKPIPGAAIIGQATGHLDGMLGRSWQKSSLRHNVETFQELIKDVSAKTGVELSVNAELDTGLSIFDGKRTWDDPKTRRLLFDVRRL